jgi:hypothetical protein
MQLSEPREQFWDVFLGDASACVFNMHHQTLILLVEAGFNSNCASLGEFLRIFDQVNHHLLEPSDIPL